MPIFGKLDELLAILSRYDATSKLPTWTWPKKSFIAESVFPRRVSSHDVSFADSLAALRIVGRLAGQLTDVGVYPSGALGRARRATSGARAAVSKARAARAPGMRISGEHTAQRDHGRGKEERETLGGQPEEYSRPESKPNQTYRTAALLRSTQQLSWPWV